MCALREGEQKEQYYLPEKTRSLGMYLEIYLTAKVSICPSDDNYSKEKSYMPPYFNAGLD